MLQPEPGSLVYREMAITMVTAAQNGYEQTLLGVLSDFPELVETKFGTQALCYAAKNGHFSNVYHLLETGADPNKLSTEEEVPLIVAAQEGHTEIVRLLLKYNAYVDGDPEFPGDTPLMSAVAFGHLETATLLLEAGADPTSKPRYASSILNMAGRREMRDLITTYIELRASGKVEPPEKPSAAPAPA